VDFLANLPWLRVVTLLSIVVPVEDDSAVFELRNLIELHLSTYSKARADFGRLPFLEHLAFIWRKSTLGLQSLTRLRSLSLVKYGRHNLDEFAEMQQLETLQLLGGSLSSIHDIGSLGALRKVRLGDVRGLESLNGIENLKHLESLSIDTCKRLTSIEPLAGCTNLRQLRLSNVGPIESLRPLRALKRLESVLFAESTNVRDGEIAFLRTMGVRNVLFQNRKHYDIKREAFTPLQS
jgi:Leucine-rich repeat (LRR) protein